MGLRLQEQGAPIALILKYLAYMLQSALVDWRFVRMGKLTEEEIERLSKRQYGRNLLTQEEIDDLRQEMERDGKWVRIEIQRLAAASYREQRPDCQGGIVLIWRGKGFGWRSQLGDARYERPGTHAVDSQGGVFKVEVRDDGEGVYEWVPVGKPVGL
ncbi:MAG: hypothetical protein CL546_01345 [Alcanivorax sp.]|nr:hypothetical protein [Alcanivorax sp.]